MTAPRSSRAGRGSRLPRAVLAVTLVFAVVSQASAAITRLHPNEDSGPLTVEDAGTGRGGFFADGLDPALAGADDVERIRQNVAFWSDRTRANLRDFVSGTRWAEAEVTLARTTGDVARYLTAREALGVALEANPDYRPAIDALGAVLVALHEFEAAAGHARTVLQEEPADPAALATLGDAALALGDMPVARGAYEQLSVVADSAAARIRRAQLALLDGDPTASVAAARAAVEAAIDEGQEGSALAWYRCQLGEKLAATGDLEGAAEQWSAALRDQPGSALARSGLSRAAAADLRWDAASRCSIATIPSPELLARRADLHRLRGEAADDRRERDDRATILAISDLAGDAAGVYDRTLSLYLATTGIDPERALQLAESELAVRRDVYGYDALAWALHANGRDEDARDAMTEALSLGTRDAMLLAHAGLIAAALGDDAEARRQLEDALALDSSFDPRLVAEVRAALDLLGAETQR